MKAGTLLVLLLSIAGTVVLGRFHGTATSLGDQQVLVQCSQYVGDTASPRCVWRIQDSDENTGCPSESGLHNNM
jgi:hypothetical protein